jgi:hypothetical protein
MLKYIHYCNYSTLQRPNTKKIIADAKFPDKQDGTGESWKLVAKQIVFGEISPYLWLDKFEMLGGGFAHIAVKAAPGLIFDRQR